jgi:hypothetical protein
VRGRVARSFGRIPRVALLCAVVALVNSVAWSMLTPPLHVPDENSHFAYTQYVAETGNLPVRLTDRPSHSDELNAVLNALRFYEVIGRVNNRPPLTPAESAPLRQVQDSKLSRIGPDANNATDNPPLYYLLAAVPYWLSPSHDLLDRLAFMRLFSALLMGLTALVVVLFLRELLPDDPWVWPVGGLLAALEPMAGFMGGGVTPDALLNLVSALTILGAARCLRRGLTVGNGLLLGGSAVAGVLTKPAFYGMVPGVVIALLGCLVLARHRGQITGVLRGAAAAVGIAAAVGALYLLLTNTILERTANAAVTEVVPGREHPFTERLSYIWQLFMPRLPGQHDLILGFPLHDLWSPELLGQFGWLDYGYPMWVRDTFWWTCFAIAAVAVVTMVRYRRFVYPRVLELLTYTTFSAGLLFGIGWADYRSRTTGTALFEQGRYLLPLLALLVGVVCVALKGLGPRIGRPVGALLVMAMLGASILGQLLTIERFYS